MRENLKKRLLVFLSILLVLPTIMNMLPQTATEVQAASYTYLWWTGCISTDNKTTITVEAGEKFYIGDYAVVSSDKEYGAVSGVKKAKYKSSKKSVASVNSKGIVTAKKNGKTTITITYKGKKLTCALTVVKKGTFPTSAKIAEFNQKADEYAKNIPSKIDVKNGFKAFKQLTDYRVWVNKNTSSTDPLEVTSAGFSYIKKVNGNTTSYTLSDNLVVPNAQRIEYVKKLFRDFSDKNSPISTRSGKTAKIASASAKTGKITIKLKKALTKEQILALKASDLQENCIADAKDNVAYFTMSIRAKKGNTYYTGFATAKVGSKTITVIPKKYSSYDSKTGKSIYKKVKLKKGQTYVLGSKLDWTKGKTVKVK